MSKNKWGFWEWFLFIGFIFLAILSLGLLFSIDGEQEDKESSTEEENEQKLRKRITELDEKILPLILIRDELRMREKKILLWIRLMIAFVLCLLNLAFWYWFNQSNNLGDQLNFNEVILLLYSFSAFIISGTLAKFVLALKKSAINRVNRKHKPTLIQLQTYEEEKKQLLAELILLQQKKNNP